MKMSIYSVLDTKMAHFGGIFLDFRDESAIRSFSDHVNNGSDPQNKWFFHPEDFALYTLGVFDQESGVIFPVEKLRCLVTASSVKREPSQLELFNNGKEKTPTLIQ